MENIKQSYYFDDMENCFYIKAEQYNKTNFEKALKFAINLHKEDSTIGRIVILVYTKNQYELIKPSFSDKMIKQGALSSNGLVFKFDTLKTYIPPSYGDKRDIVVIVAISPLDIEKLEDEYKIKYFIYVPWNMKECLSWLRAHTAIEIASQEVLNPEYPINSTVQKAIDWLKDTSFPNEGFHHPLDEDRLKSVSNALREMNIPIEDESIIKYCHENGILYNAAYKMIEFFQKAKTTHLRTRNDYNTDFFRKIWQDD